MVETIVIETHPGAGPGPGTAGLVNEKLLAILRALGDPSRMAILALLKRRTHCNCELSGRLGLPANLVSHHLKVLREAGLVVTARHPTDARWVLYSLNREALAAVAAEVAEFLAPSSAPSPDEAPCVMRCPVARSS